MDETLQDIENLINEHFPDLDITFKTIKLEAEIITIIGNSTRIILVLYN